MSLTLHGYRFSVYAWIARLTLREKGVAHGWREVDPFSPDLPDQFRTLHPFGRVPVLVHGDFVLYETSAITRYVDEAFTGPALQPAAPRERARMQQIISIVDSYAYRPMVRQVFAHSVFRPRLGREGETHEIAAGIETARTVLGALERLIESPETSPVGPTLADLHLAPMIGTFANASEGAATLKTFPRLSGWFTAISARPAYRETDPGLPEQFAG